MPVAPAPSESELAERLAGAHARADRHRVRVALRGGARRPRGRTCCATAAPPSRISGDSCVLAYPRETRPSVLLAGHLDTVPAQGNIPGRIAEGACIGLGASDMKGALAVMIELVLARAPYAALFFPREELPSTESALTPLLERHPIEADFVVVMEPTDGELHAGCLGQHQRDVDVQRALRALGAPLAGRQRDPQGRDRHRRARRPRPRCRSRPTGLTFHEVASVTKIEGGIADERHPGHRAPPHVNFRYGPGRTPAEAEKRLRAMTAGPRRARDHRQLGLGAGRARPPAGAEADRRPAR